MGVCRPFFFYIGILFGDCLFSPVLEVVVSICGVGLLAYGMSDYRRRYVDGMDSIFPLGGEVGY